MKAFLFTLTVSMFVVSYAQAAFASCGTFEVSKGDVKVQPARGPAVAASVGSKICAGDTVIAADSARAKIKMEDGNELNISPNSKIVIETYQYDAAANKKKVMLNILRGKVRATTSKENMYTDKAKDGQANTFQVRTKSAVAGVRGTDFLTGFDPSTQKTEVITFRGKVEVGLIGPGGAILKSVFVDVGQRTEVSLGKQPDVPRAMPSNDLMKQNTDSKNEPPQPSAAAPASTGASTGAPSGKEPSGRVPASTTQVSVLTPGDLPATSDGGLSFPKQPVVAPTAPVLPAVVNNNLIINNAIANKKATVNLNLIIK